MAAEKAQAIVLRTTDWSESSRIATLWTREHGKVRALAKGGRRLRSNFENALDLLTLCSIVFLRKSPGALDLLTEARVVKRFPNLASDLSRLYAGYYIAELLSEWTQEHDPHPTLFDDALEALERLGGAESEKSEARAEERPGLVVMRFEMQLLVTLGYRPGLERCTGCGRARGKERFEQIAFSAEAGGIVCQPCRSLHRDWRAISYDAYCFFESLISGEDRYRQCDAEIEAEARRVLSHYMTWLMGRRPRLLPYLEQGS